MQKASPVNLDQLVMQLDDLEGSMLLSFSPLLFGPIVPRLSKQPQSCVYNIAMLLLLYLSAPWVDD